MYNVSSFGSYRDRQTNVHPNKWIYTYFKIVFGITVFNHRNCVCHSARLRSHANCIQCELNSSETAVSAREAQMHKFNFVKCKVKWLDDSIYRVHFEWNQLEIINIWSECWILFRNLLVQTILQSAQLNQLCSILIKFSHNLI